MIKVFDLNNDGVRLIWAHDVETVYEKAGYTHIQTYSGNIYRVKESVALVHKSVHVELSKHNVRKPQQS